MILAALKVLREYFLYFMLVRQQRIPLSPVSQRELTMTEIFCVIAFEVRARSGFEIV